MSFWYFKTLQKSQKKTKLNLNFINMQTYALKVDDISNE